MSKIIAGDQTDIATITEGFNRGYQDYKYSHTFTPAQMASHLARLSIAVADCAILVAIEDGRTHGVGIGFLAEHNEQSWCGGLAVAPAYRRQGWGKKLMQTIRQRALERGIKTFWLEVLCENTTAQTLYRDLGFVTVRELLIWEWRGEGTVATTAAPQLHPMEPERILSELFAWHDQRVCWQRSPQVLAQMLPTLSGRVVWDQHGKLVGYALYRENPATDNSGTTTVRLADVAVNPAASSAADDAAVDGRALLQALQATYPNAMLTLVNEPVDSWLNPMLEACGFAVVERQYEMVLHLGT